MSEHVTARIPEDLARLLDEPERNKSKTIKVALEQYFDAEGQEYGMIRLRLQQIEDDIADLESRLTTKRNRRDHLQSLLEQAEAEQEESREKTLAEAVSQFRVVTFRSIEDPMVDADDGELEPYADDLGMTVDDLRERIIAESEIDG